MNALGRGLSEFRHASEISRACLQVFHFMSLVSVDFKLKHAKGLNAVVAWLFETPDVRICASALMRKP